MIFHRMRISLSPQGKEHVLTLCMLLNDFDMIDFHCSYANNHGPVDKFKPLDLTLMNRQIKMKINSMLTTKEDMNTFRDILCHMMV